MVFLVSKEYFFESKFYYKKRKILFLFFYFDVCICMFVLKKIWWIRNMDMIDMENYYFVGKWKIFIFRNFFNLEIYVLKFI